MDKCAPKYSDQTISCFTKDALLQIVRSFNAKNRDQVKVNNHHSKEEIWEAIQAKMSQKCGKDETCWLEQPFLKSNPSLAKFFKPIAPLGRYQWLSTDDIRKVMRQYEDKYQPEFRFVGPLPIDFLSLRDQESKYLQKLDLNKLSRSGTNQIGMVFNLDPHYMDGSHWVAMNINIPKREIHFFDSYGDNKTNPNKYLLPYHDSQGKYHRESEIPLPEPLQDFIFQVMKRITPENKNPPVKMPFKLKINTVQHQFANSECGVYSMLFLKKSMTQSFEQISNQIIMDEEANRYRDQFFRRK